jgi:hypothetical protein
MIFNNRMPRKASLELSVNAIVVLVLAITMLGLGIAFTKGKFAELGSKIEIPEPDYPATADDPIVLPANEITVSSTKDTIFSVNVYNDGTVGSSTSVTIAGACSCPGTEPSLKAVSQTIPVGEYKTFKVISSGGSSGDTCLCTLTAHEKTDETNILAEKQITLKVH